VGTLAPRAVLVTRETDWERLLAVHATREQARFFLQSRGQDIDAVQTRHEAFGEKVRQVRIAIPEDWRVARVGRGDLDRFLFGPEDIVIALGQDGLVANLAKYVSGQPVLGVNSDPDTNEGVLVPLSASDLAGLLLAVVAGAAEIERRTMARATLDDGQTLEALNEIFIGHSTHQSARYLIEYAGESEPQSSSGLIVSTGTGATGWARSIMTTTGQGTAPRPTEPGLAFFVREPWPSVASGASIVWGRTDAATPVWVTSRMNDGGVIFADGIEQDRLPFGWGRRVQVAPSPKALMLVRPR
jgi:NAD kinase